ncbi:MAG: STAS domain-containing protein [Acidobacteriota bacterium]
MELTQEKVGDVLILEPLGKLDAANAQEFQQKAAELIENGERRVVLDLGKTEHIGGAGLRTLLMIAKKLEGMGGGLTLTAVGPQVRKAIEMAGLHRQFAFAASRQEAVQRFATHVATGDKVAEVADLAAALLGKSAKKGKPARDKKK